MMAQQQKRPLNGSSVWPVAVPVAPGVTLHTLDNTSPNLGGPYIDQLTITFANNDSADTEVELVVGSGQPIIVTVTGNSTRAVLFESPFQEAGAAVVATDVGAQPGALVAWGYFTRST
jgi:hypothetical protein